VPSIRQAEVEILAKQHFLYGLAIKNIEEK